MVVASGKVVRHFSSVTQMLLMVRASGLIRMQSLVEMSIGEMITSSGSVVTQVV